MPIVIASNLELVPVYSRTTGFAPPPACSVLAASLFLPPNFVLRSKTGSGHGTPVAAQDVMIAKYLSSC